MSRIRGKDTTPERVVRSLLHRMYYHFRLHVRIPNEVGRAAPRAPFPLQPTCGARGAPLTFLRPDIVLPEYKNIARHEHGAQRVRG